VERGKQVKDLGTKATALRARVFELDSEMTMGLIVSPASFELEELRQCVEEAVAGGSNALVKALLQARIHEIRVDSRQAIHPVFRDPIGGGSPAGRCGSRTVAVGGGERTRTADFYIVNGVSSPV